MKEVLSKHPLYNTWRNIKQRCYYKKDKKYKDYGGRGIIVCKEWNNSKIFIDWALSNGWEKGLQIDRINNDGNYEPNNCRFVDHRTNNINKRNASKFGTCIRKTKENNFQVRIVINGKQKNFGTYKTMEEAQEVYKSKILEIRKLKKYKNFT